MRGQHSSSKMMENTDDAVHSTQSCYYSIFTDSKINKTHSESSKLQRINFRSASVPGSEVISFFFSTPAMELIPETLRCDLAQVIL